MPFIRRSNSWLVAAAFLAAFWITLRVMAAVPVPPAPLTEVAHDAEVADPALDVMIARFAGQATAQQRAR